MNPSRTPQSPNYQQLAADWRSFVVQISSSRRGVLRSKQLAEAVTRVSFSEAVKALEAMIPMSRNDDTGPVARAINGLLGIMEEVKKSTDGTEEASDRAFAELKNAIYQR